MSSRSQFCRSWFALLLVITLARPVAVAAQNCLSDDDLDPGAHSALEQTAQSFIRMSAAGDYASLKAAAVESLASNFGGVEAAVTEHKPDFSGARASPSAMYVLENATKATMERAEFYCGIFNSQERVAFVIPNLPAGRFAVVTEEVSGGRQPVRLSLVLRQQGNRWALAGYTVKPTQVAGHDLNWYLSQARQYKSRGQNLAAYLYCLEAWYLAQPIEIEYTVQQDKLADEMQQARPADFPSPNQPMNLTVGGKTYRVTQLFPDSDGNNLDLIVKYQATSEISNTSATFQDNMAVIKAIVARYPELRAAFAGVVARAVDSSGRDYGSLLAMKDVK
ncbi:MAG: hypothetical protein LAN64_13235 [Acidobacteriia bacterium]|nr:hypothetical protein [Terriglobia bacterium]